MYLISVKSRALLLQEQPFCQPVEELQRCAIHYFCYSDIVKYVPYNDVAKNRGWRVAKWYEPRHDT